MVKCASVDTHSYMIVEYIILMFIILYCFQWLYHSMLYYVMQSRGRGRRTPAPSRWSSPGGRGWAWLRRKQYNEETNNIYNIDKSKRNNIKNNRCVTEQYFNKKQYIYIYTGGRGWAWLRRTIIHIYIYICIYWFMYMYIYIYVCMYVCIYIYIYIYISTYNKIA